MSTTANLSGAYFVAWFPNKPTRETLLPLLEISNYPDYPDPELVERTNTTLDHILDGGGRRNYEHQWYTLTETEAGEDCHR
jgi:hypothetical protein